MSQKILSLFVAFTLLFSGCSTKTKTVSLSKDVEIRIFLTDKDENFYMFVGDKYSYIFNDKETIQELKELMELARSSGEWKLGNKPKIYLEKDFVSKIYMTFLIKIEVSEIAKLKSMGFKESKENPSFYFKDIQLIGKYGLTDTATIEWFEQDDLSHPIVFEEITRYQMKDTKMPNELAALIVPVGIVGMVLMLPFFILQCPFNKKCNP